MNRIQIIQKIINKINAKIYLEIGVAEGDCFNQINVEQKIGIDPKPKFEDSRVIKKTSDDFFHNYNQFLDKTIDVVFIDGLHTYEQALNDVENALKHLSNDGFIVMHDCNPTSLIMSDPTNEYLAEQGKAWCGDVWKSIVHLRFRNDLVIFVIDDDFGVGIITKGKPDNKLNFSQEEIKQMNYDDLRNNRVKLLNLKMPDYLDEFLQT